jgi:hypothetical protein
LKFLAREEEVAGNFGASPHQQDGFAVAFVRQGLREGALRGDVDSVMIVSLLEWTVERFQDALLTEGLDPGALP